MKSIVVVGGGFFGLYLSEYLANEGYKVRLIEKEPRIMSRASFVNQARVHNGYHYPRSILTALRSRMSFPRFVKEFSECITDDFQKYYLVGTSLSKVTAKQFNIFCDRIGAHCQPANERFQHLINPNLIEGCFSTIEYAFDSKKLAETMLARLEYAGVDLTLSTEVVNVSRENEKLLVTIAGEECGHIQADHVFNCTYSRLNYLNHAMGLPLIPLKHEMTEMCLVEMPNELKDVGITVMCGPFFSVMPFPSENLHSFSHVRYTPHFSWSDTMERNYKDSYEQYKKPRPSSAWKYMQKDAARYIPLISECRYQKSLWEVKTVLPSSEDNDSRPILFSTNHGYKGFHCVMGGKIDNVYDVIPSLKRELML